MIDFQTALQEEVRKILLKDWDPIGVYNVPEAQDEYDSYVPIATKMLLDKKSSDEIFNYLNKVETITMGLSSSEKNTRIVADKLASIIENSKIEYYKANKLRKLINLVLLFVILGVIIFNAYNLIDAYGGGSPYYSGTTNMDKWEDPVPILLTVDAITLTIVGIYFAWAYKCKNS